MNLLWRDAQAMFYGARAYDQPFDAWDVGQVTDTVVRLASEGQPPYAHFPILSCLI